ncbi:MAG: Ribosome-associated protein L7Ae-like protein [Candidatus Dichloromethanomonas elyunquensis]|nr:MAG: Ribosome-associated protein L7Ae-like protein [Candidatus Dichloromethanomonas elyunquensis]
MLDESLKKAQKVVVGLKQTSRALDKGEVQSVYVAKDADSRLLRPVLEMCRTKKIQPVEVQTMVELGKAYGIKVGAAVAAILES